MKIKELGKKILSKLPEAIINGIIFAVIASLITTVILNYTTRQKELKTRLNNISNIYIGCNKSWVDQSFGEPQFLSKKDNLYLCAYISEYYVIQVAFDKDESAQAYLITALDNDDGTKISINDKTLYNNESLTLGEFTFYNFPSSPMKTYGFASNGSGRYLYGESYYLNSKGAYYDYHIATLDYGIMADETNVTDTKNNNQIIIDDEIKSDVRHGNLSVTNRKDCYPNSYGVSTMNFDMDQTLFNYSWFNSQQLRNKYYDSN